jgi:hypothetical protein
MPLVVARCICWSKKGRSFVLRRDGVEVCRFCGYPPKYPPRFPTFDKTRMVRLSISIGLLLLLAACL